MLLLGACTLLTTVCSYETVVVNWTPVVLLMLNCGLGMSSHLEIFLTLWKEPFCFGKVVAIWYYMFR